MLKDALEEEAEERRQSTSAHQGDGEATMEAALEDNRAADALGLPHLEPSLREAFQKVKVQRFFQHGEYFLKKFTEIIKIQTFLQP